MVEPRRQPADQRQLLLADGQRSLSALQRSLSAGAAGGGEAALHIADLASLLSVLGLKAEADGLKELSRSLSEDPGTLVDTVHPLLAQLQQLLDAVQADDQALVSTLREAMALLINQEQAPQPANAPGPAPAAPEPVKASPPMTSVTPVASGASAQWPEIAPFFSAGLALPPYAAAAASAAAPLPAPEVAVQPNGAEVRAQALETIQATSHRIHAQQGAGAAQILQELALTQDGLMRVGQLPLTRAYPQAAGAADLWVDPSVSALLEHLQVFSQRASRISLQLRHLTLFVTWHGANLSQSELTHVGHRVADSHGRVDLLDAGVQLVLPASEQRMRMVAFCSAGQWHALSWAQFVAWEPAGGTATRLRLRAGVQPFSLDIDAPGPTANMNLYPWPALVPAPADLVAVALDGTGQLHQVHRRRA